MFKLIFPLFLFVFVIVGEIMEYRKREKDINKASAGKQCIREFEFIIMMADSDSEVKLTLFKRAIPSYNVLLFDDHIAFVTGFVMGFGESIPDEIEINDINFACMKYILKTDLLLVNYNRKAKEPSQFYMEGKKEDLLFIKNFIEERNGRPKIIDLTKS
ncbi:hypothetical protein J6Z39_06955 [bacterium]|nr:hypothetical protein [bacterium]